MLDLTPRSKRRNASFDANAKPREYLSLEDVRQFALQHYRTILIPAAVGMAVAIIYALAASPVFTARAQLLIDPKTPVLREQTGEVNFSLDSAQVESHIAVLRSEQISSRVVVETGLINDPELERAATRSSLNPFSWFATLSPEESAFVRLRNAINALESNLYVRRLGLSYAIEISFSSTDPDKAARIVNAVADVYVRDQIEAKSAAARQGSQWLESRLADLRAQMNAATLRVQEFRARHDYSIARRHDESASNRDSSGTISGENKPPEPTLEELETTAETFRKVYESYLQAYTSSVQRHSYPVSDARVITPATRPLSKSHPKTMLLLALGALIGIVVGLGVAIGKYTFAQRSQ